jgi:FtsP/CotA-like multicopper oxidase with cupredoxin domain
VLTVNLEARRGIWLPDGPANPSVEVHAFGEAGRALQVPGPLLRVIEGTEIRVTIRNTLDKTLVMHGLYTRDQTARSARDTIQIATGSAREIRFAAGQPGTYYYWGTTTNVPNWNGRHDAVDSQLSGAFIIDPRGTSGRPRDRVLLLSVWATGSLAEVADPSTVLTRFAINGRAWPHTERLSYALGESIHWRLINASSEVHPMHLHGFYFRVHSRGSEDMDSSFAASAPADIAVTERLAPGRTAAISWTPERPGNWLYHCHDNLHIQPSRPFDGSAPAKPEHVHNHATQLMGGLVLGVEVKGSALAKSSEPERRRLRLIARRGVRHCNRTIVRLRPAGRSARRAGRSTHAARPKHRPEARRACRHHGRE